MLVFDVNETLLDLAALDEPFEQVFGSKAVRGEWFDAFIRSALLSTAIGPYVPFGKIGRSALEAVAARHGRTLGDAEAQRIFGRLRELPAHPDVRPALERLRASGYRLAALTNSTTEVEEAQLANAGIRELFEQALSADRVQRLKPAPEPYRMAAERMGVGVGGMRLIAAHDWDVAGAMRAGCAAAFVARPGRQLDPLFPAPDIVGPDLGAVADQILAMESSGTQ